MAQQDNDRGVSDRLVLRMLAEGKSTNDIGTELFMTGILRKLGVQSRVHAAAAERTGLLADP